MVATPVIPAAGGRFTGTTSGPSTSVGSCGGGSAPEAVYKLTLAVASDVFVTTHGTTAFDTVVYMRSGGCCGAEIACNDDADGRTTSLLAQRGLAPGTYYIFVDGAGGADTGAFTVDIYSTPAATNPAEACGNPARIATTAVTGNSCNYRDEYDPPVSCINRTNTGADAVYYFVLDTQASVSFDTCSGTCFDSIAYLRDVCTGTTRACDDDSCGSPGCGGGARPVQSRVTATLGPGVHYLVLDTYANSNPGCGPFTITPTGVPP
jgi:hypothetical protein